MLRLGGLARGDLQQCLSELQESKLPEEFKLRQIRSLLRSIKEVTALVDHVTKESGFEGDTTSYLDILCAKEDADLIRRVSHIRVLRQDFDEKRRDWRKQKKSVINAIGVMTARALRFEDQERKTIALYALDFYKNIMGRNDGAILGESEGTDVLIEQYRRHRSEISKIPMYADSIVKMLKEIRKTVRASAKLQPGSNAFAQFLDEWWSSVVEFLQHSSIVEAEKNAREVMQTLKKLKCKQEENKKREISRLLSKLDDHAGIGPPVRRLSELLMPPSDLNDNPEDTGRRSDLPSSSALVRASSQEETETERDGDSSSEEDAIGPAAPGTMVRNRCQQQQQQQQYHREFTSSSTTSTRSTLRGVASSGGGGRRCGLTVSVESEEMTHSATSIRSPSSIRSRTSMMSVGAASTVSRVSWDERSVGTAGTTDAADGVTVSGVPESEDSEDSEDDDLFEAADDMDLASVDLRATGTGADGQVVYQDQESLRRYSRTAQPVKKKEVDQERFSAALDFFRQEQHVRGRQRAFPPRHPPPARSASTSKLPSPLTSSSTNSNFGRNMGSGMRGRSGVATPRTGKLSWRRTSAERDIPPVEDSLPASNPGRGLPRTLSLYIPRSQAAATPHQRASKTPTVKSRRAVLSPTRGARSSSRGAFFA